MIFRTSSHHIADIYLFPSDFDNGRIRNINSMMCRRCKKLAIPYNQAYEMLGYIGQPHPINDHSATIMTEILNNTETFFYIR